jgi:single-stranded-DNA-specific exonuclease
MRWIELPHSATPPPLPDLHPLVGQTLIKRGISTPADARAFLDPDSYNPAPASDLPGLANAVERIKRAIKNGEPMCVWGDFDVDGQTSTTVLVQTLQAIGADVTYHIPVRARESHGVNIPNLKEIIDQGAKLIVTCDTGISANEAVDYARSRGVDMVITDHHDLPETLPNATAIVNPKLLPGDHPLATLAGVGAAYKLAEALLDAGPKSNHLSPSDLLDLVALGLVADLALLKKDARYLVQKGLDKLRNTERLGLKIMMERAELTPAHLTEEHIGFMLGPRLNALGRLGDANPAVELLITSDTGRARVLVEQIEGLNTQRKLLCDQVHAAAEAQLRQDPSLLAQPIIILYHPAWPAGVIGIAASRIIERYGKPAILLCGGQDGILRGSARSVEGLHITEAIATQKDLLGNFGGHPMAAGLSLALENLPLFRKRMAKTVEKMLGEAALEEPSLVIDGWLSLADANLDLAGQLEKLAPFGPGNEKLTLVARNLTIQSSATIGKNKEHRKLTVEDEHGNNQQVLWWDGGSEEIPEEGKIDLAFSLRASDFRGVRQAQLTLVDFRVIEQEKILIKKQKTKIVDYRAEENKEKTLEEFRLQHSTVVWVESEDKKLLGGLDRNNLPECETLVIWSSPPSLEVLRTALAQTKPQKIVLFAVSPSNDEMNTFLQRLAGLVKFVLNKKGGRTTYAELATACAQGEKVTRLGVEWLVKRRQVAVEDDSNGELWITRAEGVGSDQEAEQLLLQIQQLLKETAAYRNHFAKADKETLIP